MKERKEKMRKGIKKYSPGIGKESKNKNKGSLQAACEKTRRVSLCSFRAVLTVEAAFVVPLFLLAICTLLGMIDLYRVQALVRTSLHQSTQELGMYASVESGDSGVSTPVGVLSTGICIAYTKSHLPELGDYVSVNLIGSRYEKHEIQLKATITYQLPFHLLFRSLMNRKIQMRTVHRCVIDALIIRHINHLAPISPVCLPRIPGVIPRPGMYHAAVSHFDL